MTLEAANIGDLARVKECFASSSYTYRRGYYTDNNAHKTPTVMQFWERRVTAGGWATNDSLMPEWVGVTRWMPMATQHEAQWPFKRVDPYGPGDYGIVLQIERNYVFVQLGSKRGWIPRSYLTLSDVIEEE